MAQNVLTKGLIEKALETVKPGILALLDTKGIGCEWNHICISVTAPGLARQDFQFGKAEPWNRRWGEKIDFSLITGRVLADVERERMSTNEMAALMPWVLQGISRYGGGAIKRGIAVAVAGADGSANGFIAEILLAAIIFYAEKEAATMRKREG